LVVWGGTRGTTGASGGGMSSAIVRKTRAEFERTGRLTAKETRGPHIPKHVRPIDVRNLKAMQEKGPRTLSPCITGSCGAGGKSGPGGKNP